MKKKIMMFAFGSNGSLYEIVFSLIVHNEVVQARVYRFPTKVYEPKSESTHPVLNSNFLLQ